MRSWRQLGARTAVRREPSGVAIEDRRLGDAREAVLDRAGPRLADAFDLDEIGDARAHDLRQVAEALDHVLGDRLGQARDLAAAAGSPRGCSDESRSMLGAAGAAPPATARRSSRSLVVELGERARSRRRASTSADSTK